MSDTTEIRHALLSDMDNLMPCLLNSLLCEHYFHDLRMLRGMLMEAVKLGEVYAGIYNGEVSGVMRIDYRGMFGEFPILRLVSVLDNYRGLGLGSAMLDFFEKTGFLRGRSKRVFLCVSDFNSKARQLYERRGYVQVGSIAGLYKDGITEFIMMKEG